MRSSLTLRRMRVVQVLIAIPMLAAPASAFAFAGSALAGPNDQPIKLRISRGEVRFGRAVTVTGRAPAADAGRTVVLLMAASSQSTWHQIAVSRVRRHGRFAFRIVPRSTGLLRAAVPSVPTTIPTPGEATAAAAGTPGTVRPVTVGARFAVTQHPNVVAGAKRVHLAGKLMPAIPGRVVSLQGHTVGGWRTVATVETGRRGGFRLTFRPKARSGERLRLVFAGDWRNARSTVSAGTVGHFAPVIASWYDDAGVTGCGFHATLGVANKTLPCGTHVTFQYGGRTVTATVDDRGPYVAGREYDLNQNTAAALGFSGVGQVLASVG